MSWSLSHLLVWPNSTSKAFPVGGITVPSATLISPVKVPVARVTTVIQSPLPNWMGDVHVGEAPQELLHRPGVRFAPVDRLRRTGNERDHVRVMDGVHRFEAAGDRSGPIRPRPGGSRPARRKRRARNIGQSTH